MSTTNSIASFCPKMSKAETPSDPKAQQLVLIGGDMRNTPWMYCSTVLTQAGYIWVNSVVFLLKEVEVYSLCLSDSQESRCEMSSQMELTVSLSEKLG